jgi:hypothetical protein
VLRETSLRSEAHWERRNPERIERDAVNCVSTGGDLFCVEVFDIYHQELSRTAITMRNTMVDYVFETRGRAEIELYVQDHQRYLILYLDTVDRFIHQKPNAGLPVSTLWKSSDVFVHGTSKACLIISKSFFPGILTRMKHCPIVI